MGQLQVLIADDSEFMRTVYKRVLESQSNLQIVAMATNEEEAVQKAKQTAPDMAILDIRMPILDGIQAAHEIRIQRPETAIVVMSASDDPALVADLMRNEGRAQVLSAQAVYLRRFGTGPHHRSGV